MNSKTIAEAMEREGVFQLRRWMDGQFSVELRDGRKGYGKTFRAAINDAKAKPREVAA